MVAVGPCFLTKKTSTPLETICNTFRGGQIRTDKYDGKPIYWVEEEVEVEWQKTTSRTQAESSEYQVAASLSDAMADANEPLGLDMKAIASGLLQYFVCFLFGV